MSHKQTKNLYIKKWNEEAWGDPEKSLVIFRDEIIKNWNYEICILEIETALDQTGFLFVNWDRKELVFTGASFNSHFSGRQGSAYYSALTLLALLGLREIVTPVCYVKPDENGKIGGEYLKKTILDFLDKSITNLPTYLLRQEKNTPSIIKSPRQ